MVRNRGKVARGKGQGFKGQGKPPHRHATCSLPLAPCPLPLATLPLAPKKGFTLVELLVVLSIIALLLSLAAPRYFKHVDRSREVVLRENLATLRDALDQYHADKGHWPDTLETLATDHYLRALPVDPVTTRTDTWTTVAGDEGTGVRDVKSGAEGEGGDGTPYADW